MKTGGVLLSPHCESPYVHFTLCTTMYEIKFISMKTAVSPNLLLRGG